MNNIFKGTSGLTICVKAWDRLLREQEWVSVADVQREVGYAGMNSMNQISYDGFIKKAKNALREELQLHGLCFKEQKDSADRRITYTAYPDGAVDPLHNLRVLAAVDEALSRKTVLDLVYAPSYQCEDRHLFHPQYIRDYNGRYYVYGEYERAEENGEWPFIGLAIDRIVSAEPDRSVRYKSRPAEFFMERLKDTVSPTLNISDPKVYDVRIRTHTPKIHMLLMMNPLHFSQREVSPCGVDAPGEISLHVQYSIELLGKLLYYGGEIEVLAPDLLRERMSASTGMMAGRYKTE